MYHVTGAYHESNLKALLTVSRLSFIVKLKNDLLHIYYNDVSIIIFISME